MILYDNRGLGGSSDYLGVTPLNNPAEGRLYWYLRESGLLSEGVQGVREGKATLSEGRREEFSM